MMIWTDIIRSYIKKKLCFILVFYNRFQSIKSQNLEPKLFAYNALIGGFTGGIGALINKKERSKNGIR